MSEVALATPQLRWLVINTQTGEKKLQQAFNIGPEGQDPNRITSRTEWIDVPTETIESKPPAKDSIPVTDLPGKKAAKL